MIILMTTQLLLVGAFQSIEPTLDSDRSAAYEKWYLLERSLYSTSLYPGRTIRSVYGRLRSLYGPYYGRNIWRRNTALS
jgi:hypothetical protein